MKGISGGIAGNPLAAWPRRPHGQTRLRYSHYQSITVSDAAVPAFPIPDHDFRPSPITSPVASFIVPLLMASSHHRLCSSSTWLDSGRTVS